MELAKAGVEGEDLCAGVLGLLLLRLKLDVTAARAPAAAAATDATAGAAPAAPEPNPGPEGGAALCASSGSCGWSEKASAGSRRLTMVK